MSSFNLNYIQHFAKHVFCMLWMNELLDQYLTSIIWTNLGEVYMFAIFSMVLMHLHPLTVTTTEYTACCCCKRTIIFFKLILNGPLLFTISPPYLLYSFCRPCSILSHIMHLFSFQVTHFSGVFNIPLTLNNVRMISSLHNDIIQILSIYNDVIWHHTLLLH